MSELDRKLQLRAGQTLACVGAPPDAPPIDAPEAPAARADAVLVWVRSAGELETRIAFLQDAAKRDATTWLAYPKAGRLGADVNRDTIRARLAEDGLAPVRQIALDDTWSALRVRRRIDA